MPTTIWASTRGHGWHQSVPANITARTWDQVTGRMNEIAERELARVPQHRTFRVTATDEHGNRITLQVDRDALFAYQYAPGPEHPAWYPPTIPPPEEQNA